MPASPTMTEARPRHAVTRVRHDTRRRTLTVTLVERITPGMARVHFASPELRDFASLSPDDHVKLFFPVADGDGSGGGTPMRDYTPRRFDAEAGTLVIDFALHGASHDHGPDIGPATAWAIAARPGATLEIGGPRGSLVVPDDFDWVLLIGDETALPAIGRRVEALRPGVPVTTIVVVDGAAEQQVFATRADWTPVWVVRQGQGADDAERLLAALADHARPAADWTPVRLSRRDRGEQGERGDDAALLLGALADHVPPTGEGYVWIAAEARVARALRAHMGEVRRHPEEWMRSSGYWVRGEPGAHE